MGRANRRSILGEQIAEILGTANSRINFRAAATRSLVCGGMALLVVAPAQVEAVGLGEIRVQSTLGRPLQAVVPMRIGTGESLPANCVKPGAGRGELTKPGNVRVKSPAATEPGTYNLRISTPNSLHEPMYELSLVINCPGTPVLVRHYVLMLDLPGTLASVPAVETAAASPTNVSRPPAQLPGTVVQNAQPVSTTDDSSDVQSYAAPTPARPDPSRSLERSVAPIQAGTLYRIRQGDTLSTVAARIDGRLPDTTWAVAEQLFAANPDAFIRNNPDLIKLGSLIRIPEAAELASILPLASTSLTQQRIPAKPEPAPAPSVEMPTVIEQRNEAVRADASPAINPQAELVLESNLVPVEITSENYQEIATAESVSDTVSNTDAAPVESATPEVEEFVEPVVSSPFADEDPANIPVNTVEQQTMEQVSAESVAEPASDKISPWFAIGVGLLLGLAVSALLLRRRIVSAILSLFPRRDDANAFATKMAKSPSSGKASPTRAKPDTGTNEFDTLAADAAFDTSAGEADGAPPPLKIGDPLEKTYIVESFEHEPTQEVDESPFKTTDTSLQEKLDTSPDPVALPPGEKSDDEMLAEIFEEIPGDESFDGGTGMFEPTAQLPKTPEEEIFDPSGGLPQHLGSDIIDPTTDIPIDPTADVDSTLMQAFTEELDQIDPELFGGSAQIDGAAEMTESEQITNHAAEETSLDALPKSSEEDDILSETLYDALTLLEHDYEDEFTASQILERSAIKKSLATLDGEKENDDEADDRKLTG